MRIARLLIGLTLLGVAAAFPYGPLFPWSPWKPGYAHIASTRGDVYYDSSRALPEVYRRLDSLIAEAETFHGFQARSRITVVVCANWGQFTRLAPQIRGRGVGAITLATGTAIYVTPKLDERGFDHAEFLRHELSHAVLHQNQTLVAAYRSANTWMFEGLAVSFGRQNAYRTREEFVAWTREHELDTLLDPERRDAAFDIRMAYTAWRYFNEHLKATQGAAYRRFLSLAMVDPTAWRPAFAQAFGIEFAPAVKAFRHDVAEGRWKDF